MLGFSITKRGLWVRIVAALRTRTRARLIHCIGSICLPRSLNAPNWAKPADRHERRGGDVARRQVDCQEQQGREKVADQLRDGLHHCALSSDRPPARGGNKRSRWAT